MDSQSALLGDRGSCSVDSGVRISSDRESGVTSSCGNLSDSTTDGAPTIALDRSSLDTYSIKDDIYQREFLLFNLLNSLDLLLDSLDYLLDLLDFLLNSQFFLNFQFSLDFLFKNF